MSDTRFTPGPWRVQPGHSVLNVRAEAGIVAVAGDAPYWKSFDATDHANAHLIAAAPEMFSALTQCLGVIVEIGNLNGFRNLSDEELGRAWQAVAKSAAAVLSKARGEQP